MEENPTVGRYEILDELLMELGQETVTTFYKGRDPRSELLVAIKTIRFSSELPEEKRTEIRDRFFREAAVQRTLSHPGIACTYDAGHEGDLLYLVTEFLEGDSVEVYCQKGSLLPLTKVLDIVAEMAGILAYVHSNGVIHRNLKPANVMILQDGTVKITGFALALCNTDPKPTKRALLGTPKYMSPEQAMGLEIDARSDIFSLGAIFFRLLTGELPFKGKDLKSLLTQIARKRHPSVRGLDPRIPPGVERIVDKALAKNPDKRYQRASEVAEDIRLADIL